MGMTRTLNGREADRLFRSWGFVPLKTKGRHAGGHKFYAYQDESGPRTSITAPGRKHGTPEVAYRKAAQIVGVSYQEFLQGPAKVEVEAKIEVETLPVIEETVVVVESTNEVTDVPEAREVVVSAQEQVQVVTENVEEEQEPTPLTLHEERMLKVLAYLEQANRPLLYGEIMAGLGLTTSALRGAVDEGVRQEMIFSRYATGSETRGKTGRRPLLYSHVFPVPRRREVILEQPETRLPSGQQIGMAKVTFTVVKVKQDGSLVLLREDGTLLVAREVEV